MILFLSMVVVVSLSGVMMPGPVFTACVVKGYREPTAGLKIALGHSLVEIPIILLLVFGLKHILDNRILLSIIGVAGGSILAYMGFTMVRYRHSEDSIQDYLPYNTVTIGVMTTLVNPYFFLWWATVGASLIAQALGFPSWFIILFAAVHLLCDIVWDFVVSYTVFRSRNFWTKRIERIVFSVFGVLLIGFGIKFIVSPFVM